MVKVAVNPIRTGNFEYILFTAEPAVPKTLPGT